ncbi:MAG: aminopeptidase P family protein [Actinobacteria bacterium]|nr:aminopeptidase P family protein [Actinomycetota bacterium]
MDHVTRRKLLTQRCAELDFDALLVTKLANVRYLTGFTGSWATALLSPAESVFFTDGRYGEQARHEVPDLIRVASMDNPVGAIHDHIRRLGIGRLGFERHSTTVSQFERWQEVFDGVELKGVDQEVERLRWAKDADEIALLRSAQEATDGAFEDVLDLLVVGITERQAGAQLELAMARHGADALSFDPIVAFGEHAAEPHHQPCHRALTEGDVIKMDFGALVGGYHTDMTRTVAFGEPASELRKVHDVVAAAQQAGIDALRPGVSGGDVDRAARRVIDDAGYGDRFTHGLGHGVGLEIHEGPSLRRDGEDVLPVGAVVTVEPGIYLPGMGGVRIEDAVALTEEGPSVLGVSTRELIEL